MEREFDALFRDMTEQGFGMQDNILPDQLITDLHQCALHARRAGRFENARVGPAHQPQHIPAIRGDTIHWLDPYSDDPVQYRFLDWADRLRRQLNREFFLSLKRSEFHFAVYESGRGYARHLDQHRGQPHRRISFVLYLTPDRQPDDGGELCLFHADDPEQECLRIAPERGRIVMFRSDLPHSVLPAHKPRWSLSGWMRDDAG